MVTTEVMNKERLDRYILEAAKAAGYTDGFGVTGCDLNLKLWWAAYTRQSTREQAENDRLSEYLLTCAKLAKQRGVVVPREYVIYDALSSEDFNRPGITRLRRELIVGRRIAGVIIPFQGRLSADPLHQLTFERECAYYGVQVIYGDAPGGQDWGSQTTRLIQAQANALRVKCNRDNALAGNIARVLAGKVPAHRASYGYTYRADKIIEPRTGRAKVLRAWWEINELGPDGEPVWESQAWVVRQIFVWLGDEGRTAYWVAKKLNELRIPPPFRTSWAPKTVIKIAGHKCYTGKAEYNANGRFVNPDRPLGDLTLGMRRTLIRPKPDGEKVTFEVSALTTEEQWVRANNSLRERGRGRGKQGKRIRALFRGRMLCPRCRKPMSVLQKKGRDQVYYYCRAHYCLWLKDPCSFNRFAPGTWDDEIWEEICTMLSNDAWLEQQLTAESSRAEDIEKLIRLEQVKINQAKIRIGKVQEGWEKGFYTPGETRTRIADHQGTIAKAEAEIKGLQDQMMNKDLSTIEAELLREQIRSLRDRNLRQSAFEEKADLVAKLGLKILPTEDLKSRKIYCRLNLAQVNKGREQYGFAKVTFGGAEWTERRTFELVFSLK
ncbi:MAG: recombinase family protein [Dehalococcoidia bacterium]|nr:recombinase family protein [Dehalococcoidia bacterium]